jgi:hypothetical protein
VIVAATEWVSFSSGGIALGSAAIALFFLRFWRQTADRFFLLFAAAFAVLAANRIVLLVQRGHGDEGTVTYLIRLIAFLLILGAIVDKNRESR